MGRQEEKYPGLRQYIITNERMKGTASYKAPADIAAKFGCSLDYLYHVRRNLAVKNRIHVAETTPYRKIRISNELTAEGLLKDLESEHIVTATERLAILSRMIRQGAPPLRLQAIKLLEELTKVDMGRVGPPPPLTEEDAVARLAKLLMACGEDISRKALEVAFGTTEDLSDPSEALPEALDPEAPEALQSEPGDL